MDGHFEEHVAGEGEHLATMTTADHALLRAAADAVDLDEAAGEAMHLLLSPGRCSWVVQSRSVELVLDRTDSAVTGDVPWVPVSDRVGHFVAVHDDDVTLRLVDGITVTAECDDSLAAVDLVRTAEPPTPWGFEPTATVTVDTARFVALLWSARFMPGGIEDDRYPTPPMWLCLGADEVGLHVDWTDFVPSRSTYRLRARHGHGVERIAIPHSPLETVLRAVHCVDEDREPLDLVIESGMADIDGDAVPAVRLSGPGWRCTVRAVDPLRARWSAKVREQLDTLEDDDTDVLEQTPTTWLVDTATTEVHVRLHGGHPDLVRVSACLVTDVPATLDLLRELSELNAASEGVRFWWEDHAVHVADDVRCTVLGGLPDAVREVCAAATQYAPILTALG